MTYKLVWKKCLLQGALFNLSLNFLIINLPVSFDKPLSAPRNVAADDKKHILEVIFTFKTSPLADMTCAKEVDEKKVK